MGVHTQPENVTATFYAQVEPRWSQWQTDPSGHPVLEKVAVVGLTQERPRKPRSGVVVTKLSIQFPTNAFLPLRPEAVIVVPADLTALGSEIEVQAFDPRDPDAVDPVVDGGES